VTKSAKKKFAKVAGGTRERPRGAYCTPKKWADRLPHFLVDPFSNDRSHIRSDHACWLERGDDGFGDGTPGSYFLADPRGRDVHKGVRGTFHRVGPDDMPFLQPDYLFVIQALQHYAHTRFIALLRFDPSTKWFINELRPRTELIAVPLGERFDFDAPPEVDTSSNPIAHAFYFARKEDAPTALLRHCEAWTRKIRRAA
jgi:hypothetical protein